MSNETWTLGRLLDWTANHLKEKSLPTPRLEAEVLLAHVVGCQRIGLYTRFDEPASEQVRGQYRDLIRKRLEGCPVAYLVGFKEFYSLRFAVSPAVLIPRPETEVLVLEAIRLLKGRSSIRVADVGTGSGAIAVTLAKHLPQATLTAVDISPEALRIAQQNAQRHGVAEKIQFITGDLLEALPPAERFDLIAANLPYVASEAWPSLETTVTGYEPRLALEGGPGGTEVIARLIPQAAGRLQPRGYLLLEIASEQADAVGAMLNDHGFQQVTILPDHAGLPRVARGQSAG